MDEVEDTAVEPVETVGQRLRAAREAQGLSVEDIAATTRIPTRHLESLETSDWDALPAPTYSMGFAKSYAAAVGLDRAEIADQLRGEMGGLRPVYQQPELFEPADPKRAMPKGLVLGALAALVVVALLLTWLSNRDLADNSAQSADNAAAGPVTAAPIAPAPVVITANETAWIDVRDGQTILKQGELAAGQSFEVPANAIAPTLSTAKPESLRISIGTADAPPVGAPGTKVEGVSLKADDLMKGPPPAAAPAAAAPPPVASPAPAPRSAPTRRSQPRTTTPAKPAPAAISPAASPPPPTTNTAG